jgi:hypothetical protein
MSERPLQPQREQPPTLEPRKKKKMSDCNGNTASESPEGSTPIATSTPARRRDYGESDGPHPLDDGNDESAEATVHALRAQAQYAVQVLAEMQQQRDELLAALNRVLRECIAEHDDRHPAVVAAEAVIENAERKCPDCGGIGEHDAGCISALVRYLDAEGK